MITRGEEMLALRRRRMAAAPPFFRGGFRPFFFGGAVWAPLALAIWLCSLAGLVTLQSQFDPLAWHRHEMLFGFVGAVVAGFLLTAIPNWTGRLPIAGAPLVILFGTWAAARAAVLFSAQVGMAFAALLDVGFYLVLALLAAREVVGANNRNRPIVGLVLLFGIANGVDHAAAAGLIADSEIGWMFGLSMVIMMISLIGGRIVPSFTRNWMTKHGLTSGLPTQPSPFDVAVVAITALALLAWLTVPVGPVSGGLLLAAGILQAVRLARWRGWKTARDPMVVILHVGYAWVPAGLVSLGLSMFTDAVPRSAAVHALTAGAMGTMILAVMSRATLGHTGRELKANSAMTTIFLAVTIAALLRVAAPLGIADYTLAMQASAIVWGAAFLLFLAVYGPILFAPRLGEE